jgi:hypothetical protein
LLALALAIGAGLGWLARSPDLLAANAPALESPPPPGLWMAPWAEVPPQPTAEAQYRYALLRSPEEEREAAWLAVPGRFPQAREWPARAYTQLARELFRHRDAERLTALSAELARSDRGHDKTLARIAHAAALALGDEAEEVVEDLGELKSNTLDPALAELTLEVVQEARRSPAGQTGYASQQLGRLRNELAQALQVGFLEQPQFGLIKID